jgi:hypothetical protein
MDSPIDPTQSRHLIEMAVFAQHGKTILAGERRNPNVVRRNGSSGFFQFTPKRRIGGGCFFIDAQYAVVGKRFLKPLFVTFPIARLPNA